MNRNPKIQKPNKTLSTLILTLVSKVKTKWHNQITERIYFEFLNPFFWKLRRKKVKANPPLLKDCTRVLIWNLDSLGDALWITPSLSFLKNENPDVEISLLCNRNVSALFEANPNLGKIIPIDPSPFYKAAFLFPWNSELKELSSENFDLMVILEAGSRPSDYGRIFYQKSKCKYAISTQLGLLKFLVDFNLPENQSTTQEYWPRYYLKTFEHLLVDKIKRDNFKIEIFTSEKKKHCSSEKVKQILETTKTRSTLVFGIHPFVANYALSTKQWPLENFQELILALHNKYKCGFYFSGGPDDQTQANQLITTLRSKNPEIVITNLALNLDFFTLFSLMKRTSVFISCDTSVLHLTEAAQVPTIAFFGATNEKLLTPPNAVSITHDISCRPCHKYKDKQPFWPRCQFDTPLCLTQITHEFVLNEIETLLNSRHILAQTHE